MLPPRWRFNETADEADKVDMGTLIGRTFALAVNATAAMLLAFFAFGPSAYSVALRVLFGFAALGAAVAVVASFVKLRRAMRSSS